MPHPVIAFVIETNLLSPAQVKSYVKAQQVQLDRDVYPRWGLTATCVFVDKNETGPPGAWVCAFLDNSDQADALGYHDVTPQGLPVMKIFVADTLRDGLVWTVTASHEVIETLGDPEINQVVDVGGIEFAHELCDAPEDDRFAYSVSVPGSKDSHRLSAFVTPAWFDPAGRAPFTFPLVPEITAPFMLAEGGYIGERVLPDGQWTQKMAARAGPRQFKAPTSRTLRRFDADEQV